MLSLIPQLLRFMRVYRRYWLGPIIGVLLAFGILLVVASYAEIVAPIIYTIF